MFNVDFYFRNFYSFDDSPFIEDVNGYRYRRSESSDTCYRYSFSSLEGIINFLSNDFDETANSLDDNFVQAVITIACKSCK